MTSGGIAVLYVPDRIHAEVYRRLPKIARYLWTRSAKGAGIGLSARARRLGPGPQPSASGANVSGEVTEYQQSRGLVHDLRAGGQ